MDGYDISIAGGGIAGLSAAIALGRSGHRVTVHERGGRNDAIGAGIALQPNGLAVLHALGVAPELEPLGSRIEDVSLFDREGRVLSRFTIPDFGGGFDHALVLHRRDLLHALRRHAIETPGVTVVFDQAFAATDGRTADVVVAADGIASDTRATANIEVRKGGGRHVYLRAIATGTCPKDAAGEHWGPHGITGILPCGTEQVYVFATMTAGITAALEHGDDVELRRAITEAHAALAPYASSFTRDTVLVNRASSGQCSTFVDGNIVLIGDAAHAMEPNLGQGANSALVDVAHLALALHGTTPIGDALQRYDTIRRPAVQRVQQRSQLMADLAHRARGRSVRDLAVRATPTRALVSAFRAGMQCDPADLAHDVEVLVRARTPR